MCPASGCVAGLMARGTFGLAISTREEVGAHKRRRLTPERARQLVTDFELVTIRELRVDLRRAVDLGLELSIYAYDAYILGRCSVIWVAVARAER